MYKNRRQNSRTTRTKKLAEEINTLILECYQKEDMRNLEKLLTVLTDANVRAEFLLREIESNMCVRDFRKHCDYCRR